MNDSFKVNNKVSKELIIEAQENLKNIYENMTVGELIQNVEYDINEDEMDYVMNIKVTEYLEMLSRSGLY